MTTIRSRITGTGGYLPERVVTNEELAAKIDSSDSWIVTRTGIRQRHMAAEGEVTSDLGCHAGARALATAGLTAADVDLVVVATSTPDDTFPATATQVQAKLGIHQGAAFDVQAVCSGFVYALAIADNFIKAGQVATALVVGAETYSRILDWDDRGTCVLFGDGAGAVVVQAVNGVTADAHAPQILSTHLHADGRYRDILYVDGGPSQTGTVGHLRMAGKEVFRHAVSSLASVAAEALAANRLSVADLDWVIPHQANIRIIEGLAKRLGIPSARIVVTVDRHANTSAASIPLALDEAVRDGRLVAGDLVLVEAIGGGLTWGAALVRW
ncbi:MAG: beta-ketoacyl-ACP synthase III [Rhodospirillales bacterium]